MNYLLYGIVSIATFLFVLIIILVISLLKKNDTQTGKEEYAPRRCPTCGQILEGDWNRCPFCMDNLGDMKTYHTEKTIPNIMPIGYLLVKTGADRGKIYRIEENQIRIGSGNQNDIIINDENISPQHSKIHFSDNSFFINDLHSQQGTKVNNRSIDKQQLYDNDVIELANNFFVFKILD